MKARRRFSGSSERRSSSACSRCCFGVIRNVPPFDVVEDALGGAVFAGIVHPFHCLALDGLERIGNAFLVHELQNAGVLFWTQFESVLLAGMGDLLLAMAEVILMRLS